MLSAIIAIKDFNNSKLLVRNCLLQVNLTIFYTTKNENCWPVSPNPELFKMVICPYVNMV